MAIAQTCTRKGTLVCLSFPSTSTRSSTRILGRKRVAVPPAPISPGVPAPERPLRKQRSTHIDDAASLLESLPEDVLIKVLCKVNHSDLKQLLLVSKPVSKATIVAKELHFAFATPAAKTRFREEEFGEDDEHNWAPKQRRVAGRSRLGGKDLAGGIAVNLSAAFDRLLSEA